MYAWANTGEKCGCCRREIPYEVHTLLLDVGVMRVDDEGRFDPLIIPEIPQAILMDATEEDAEKYPGVPYGEREDDENRITQCWSELFELLSEEVLEDAPPDSVAEEIIPCDLCGSSIRLGDTIVRGRLGRYIRAGTGPKSPTKYDVTEVPLVFCLACAKCMDRTIRVLNNNMLSLWDDGSAPWDAT